MTLQLDLSPEEESVLKAKAARLGVPLDRYARGVLRRDAEANGSGHAAAGAQTRRALEELARYAESLPDRRAAAGLGPLPDDAVAQSYRDREDAQL